MFNYTEEMLEVAMKKVEGIILDLSKNNPEELVEVMVAGVRSADFHNSEDVEEKMYNMMIGITNHLSSRNLITTEEHRAVFFNEKKIVKNFYKSPKDLQEMLSGYNQVKQMMQSA